MDALFDAINVRDLLSTGDLTDPTSPLSAPDLRLLISRLESHSLQIKSRVKSYLLSHHNDFSSLFSLCNDTVSQTNQISENVSDLVNLLSDSPVHVEITEIVEEATLKMKELRVKRELLDLVRGIVGISERLRGVREAIQDGRFKFAAQELRELKTALRIGDEEEKEPVVYGLLRKEWLDCFEEIQEMLERFMENAVQFEPNSGVVRIKNQLSIGGTSGISLHTVLATLEVIEVLHYGLARVADKMIKFVITPAVNSGSSITFVEDSEKVSEDSVDAILKMVPSSNPQVEDADGKTIYSGVIQVVRFIFERLCFQNESWIRCFGRLTWPSISELIIANFLSKAVPEDASKLADFQNIIKRMSEFETDLKEMNFISASDSADQKLSNFAENVEVHFASRKKTETLAKARNLLLQCDFAIPQEYIREGPPLKSAGEANNSSEHVVDLLFLSERCVVSKAASQLMDLVHNTLKDVCMSSPRVALEFYHAARDAILLYEAVIPVKLERQLDGINQVGVLMHNDCLYLSQEILGLAFEYRSDFPGCIKDSAVFVDMAPRFHVMAEDILHRQIQLVVFNLKEAIDGADGFQNTHQMKEFESAKFSTDQVVFILEKVRIIWEPLLLPSTYQKSMSMVLECVFSRIARDILLIDDMAADETLQSATFGELRGLSGDKLQLQVANRLTPKLRGLTEKNGQVQEAAELQKLIYMMLESLASVMESLITKIQKKSEEKSRYSLHELIPSLRKIRKLAELLDMPLKSITNSWESGELLSCGFTMLEVQCFIKAIFTDSPLRKECLWRIQNVSF